MAISREQVFKVADELAAAGQRPTLQAIRHKIGGSYSTLSPLLREWKAAKASADAPLQEPVPGSISGRLEDFAAEIWRVALELADSRLAAEREALEQTRKELESERDESVQLADSLAGELDAARAELDAARAEIAGLRERAQADAIQIAELRGRLAALEPLLDEFRAARVAADAA
jgi:chromosome segregation ATPase